jgi:outer membrane protein assembly factor BamA
MTTQTTLLLRAFIAALLLCLAPFAHSQSDQTTGADPLVVQDVICAGNDTTSCDFIRGHLYLDAGQVLDENEVRNAELRLSSLSNFESVNIRLEKGAQRGAVIVVIEVKEASPITTEWLLGASSMSETRRGVIAGRIAHQNLFGQGKIADLSAVAIIPFAGDEDQESYDVTLRYVDPQLFDSSRYFGIVAASLIRRRYQDIYGNFNNLDAAQFDLKVGRRFADFSYLTIGWRTRPNLDWSWGRWDSGGAFEARDAHPHRWMPSIAYGWNSEDDLNFPTQGSTLQIAAGGDYQGLQFRKTWPMLGGWGTLKFGGDPSPEYRSSFSESQLLAFTYARPVAAGDNIQRGRWYVEPGLGFVGYSPGGVSVYEYGLKAGFRANTRLFGLVDLYVLGRVDSYR